MSDMFHHVCKSFYAACYISTWNVFLRVGVCNISRVRYYQQGNLDRGKLITVEKSCRDSSGERGKSWTWVFPVGGGITSSGR